ncbi:uncharacterized protein A4U43_C06F760 [Asparagus officinalis]|uniref:Uncharacterized protein n=1 Tax=Asparagus officinalis TaxID=4686 RepID=A0A5P1EIP2_ASPOF|nr:uncharacterized protein A4U43_C06F760 [Asparagus officinalis]
MNDALEAASIFFDLSAEEKEKFASDDRSKLLRYRANPKDDISRARDILKFYAQPLSEWIHIGNKEKLGKTEACCRFKNRVGFIQEVYEISISRKIGDQYTLFEI